METWLTYLAALLMAGATAFTFSSSSSLFGMMSTLTSYLTGVAAFLFLGTSIVTMAAGTASLRKNKLGGKVLRTTILWAVITTLVLSFLGAFAARFVDVIFPVSASAGGDYESEITSFLSVIDPLCSSAFLSKCFIPALIASFILGVALTPSSDIIRPAYTVMNSFSEVMYRIQRTLTYFGACYVYVAATTFFLGLWQEKTAFAAPEPFIALIVATLVVVLVILPLLFAFFTGFKKNPYGVIGRGLSGLITAFVSGNMFASSLIGESLSRSNLGIQKRISSTVTPLSIVITRGGTAFVSTVTVITLLKTLGAEISMVALILLTLAIAGASFLSSLFSGIEVAAISVIALKMLNINIYGAEAAIVSLIPFINGCALLIDMTLSLMANAISGARTKTDAKIPLKDTI
ncbi:MAG: dicarboxylate/amino acid:cation symporter [Spirochaetales bacterium]|nr:dicarboxylate/amino acid:cation symporter [Spirochaetales bacterium]